MGGMLFTDDPGGGGAFVIFTVLIGGAAAWATGRAFAATWRSAWVLPLALLAIAAVVRFLHYALTGTTLFPSQEDIRSIHYFVVSLVFAGIVAAFGFRARRTEQMTRQYPWLFAGSGPFSWVERDAARARAGPPTG